MNAKEKKNTLRDKMKKQRVELSSGFIVRESAKIAKKVLQLKKVQSAKSIFIYVSIGDEVATYDLIKTFLSHGKIVCVPKMLDAHKMIPVQIFSLDNLAKGALGIQEPRNNYAFEGDIDFCIVPGLAFDHNGRRLGMGKGHYDRFFDKNKKTHTLGLVFDQFVVQNVPQETHDYSMDELLSQSQHIYTVRQ